MAGLVVGRDGAASPLLVGPCWAIRRRMVLRRQIVR